MAEDGKEITFSWGPSQNAKGASHPVVCKLQIMFMNLAKMCPVRYYYGEHCKLYLSLKLCLILRPTHPCVRVFFVSYTMLVLDVKTSVPHQAATSTAVK